MLERRCRSPEPNFNRKLDIRTKVSSILGYSAKIEGKNSRPGSNVDVLSLGLHDEGCFGGRVLATGKHADSPDGSANSVYLIHCAVGPQISFLR